jgi:hypothetical protein
MKIAIIGTDPAGLYFACLTKARQPRARIEIFRASPQDRTEAAPHILINPVKPELRLQDRALADAMLDAGYRSKGVTVVRDGERIVAPGHSYTFAAAQALAELLETRATATSMR